MNSDRIYLYAVAVLCITVLDCVAIIFLHIDGILMVFCAFAIGCIVTGNFDKVVDKLLKEVSIKDFLPLIKKFR